METPRVSICCSVLDQAEWLREMIASVVAQTYKEWELIVVDDGSTQDVKAVVDSFADPRISFHRFPENKGIPHGSNWALERIRGEFFGLLAADEVISPEKLEDQLAYMDANPAVDGIWGIPGRGPWGKRPEWEQNEFRAHNRSREHWLRTLLNLEGVPIGGASFLMRRKVIDSIGMLDPKLTIFSDHEFYCRFFEKHEGRILPWRWAKDKEATVGSGSVREKHHHKVKEELAYVRSKHPLPLPTVEGKSTIGIPVFNMKDYVLDALKSAQAQTFTDLDIVILDDGSTDGTMEVVRAYLLENPDPRVRLMAFDENRGLMETMNQMAFRAQGTFFTSLAADDKMEPTFVEKCRAEFAANPWLEMVGTQTDFMDATGKILGGNEEHPFTRIPKAANHTREEWLGALYHGNHYFGASMYRTAALSEVGGWDKRHGVLADYEMYLRLLMRDNIRVIEEPLTHTRIHGKNLSLLRPSEFQKLPQLYHDAKKPYYKPVMKVIIATPFYDLKGFSPYIVSLVYTLKMLDHFGIQWDFLNLSGDSYVHKARNIICDIFLQDPDATDLFFIDSDESWNPDAFLKMLFLPEPVVGGSYAVKNRWGSWTSRPEMATAKDGSTHYIGRALPDGTGLIKAEVIAGGFLRIKRDVLLQYREHFPDLWFTAPSAEQDDTGNVLKMKRFTEFFSAQADENKVFTGEDHFFSKRMRSMGVPMFIYPNVDITHWGIKGYDGNYHKFLKEQIPQDQRVPLAPGLDTMLSPADLAQPDRT